VKNPVHLKTSGLVFNESTGVAQTDKQVEFSVPQASGTAEGVTYDSKARTLTLARDLHLVRSGPQPVEFWANHGVLNSDQPAKAVFQQARVRRPTGMLEADEVTLYVRPDQSLERVIANGNLRGNSTTKSKLDFRAQHAEVLMTEQENVPRRATFTGAVEVNATGDRPMHAKSNRVVTDFTSDGRVKVVHALEGTRITQPPQPNAKANAQAVDLTADAVDFFVRNGDTLERAETLGAAQITSTPVQTAQAPANKQPAKTTVTAGKFVAGFNKDGRLTSAKGSPNAKMVTSTPGEADRTTTSREIEVAFEADGTVANMVQQGSFEYHEPQKTGDRAAYADKATYDPKSEMLKLTGSPRVVDGGMTTTAETVLLNRTTGDAEAQTSVKTTYSDVKANQQGGLFSSSAPVHITGRNMTAQKSTGLAKYTGNARLWQDTNIIEAPTITFDRDKRQLVASSSGNQVVSTVLVQQDKTGKAAPVYVKSQKLTYDDNTSIAHFEGAVNVRGNGGNMNAGKVDVYLAKRTPGQPAQPGATQLDRIVAENNVKVEQQARRATGSKLVYTPSDEKFVMTGGPPTITDPEHGTITGTSLTFFRADDRVLVEGGSSRTVTTTRVSR